MVRSQLNPNRRSLRCTVLLFQEIQLRYSLEPEREQKICSFFTDSETKVSNHSYQEEEEEDDDEEEEEESFEGRCGDRDGEERHDERTQTRTWCSFACCCASASSDAGIHPKGISGWKKSSKGSL